MATAAERNIFYYSDAVPVTPSDVADLPRVPAVALYIGAAGTLRVTMLDGGVRNFGNVSAGTVQLAVARVHSTGTTATGIMALYT